jgi:hypothetical protein
VPAGSARQLDLLDDDRWRRLERAADVARDRFGDAAVTRGALLDDVDDVRWPDAGDWQARD